MINGKLKGVNMFSFVFLAMTSIRLITLPGDIVKYAKTDAWLSVLLIGILSIMNGYVFYFIAAKHPGLNFVQINIKLLGKIMGKVVALIICIYVFMSVGLSLRLLSNGIKVFLLDKTPSLVIILVFISACAYCLIKGIKTISIVFDIFLPIILLFSIVPLFLTYKNADLKNLLPVLHKGFKPVIAGSLQMIDPALGGSIIAYVMPYFENIKETKKWILLGVIVSIVFYFLIVVMSIMVLGVKEIEYLNYPTITLAKAVELKAEVFERTESFFMATWIPKALTTMVIYYIASTMCIKEIFNTGKTNIVILAQLTAFVIIALIPDNIVQLYDYLKINNMLAIFLDLIYVPIFLFIVILKDRGEKSHG
jgi:spore germination protein